MIKSAEKITFSEDAPIIDALKALEASPLKIIMLVNDSGVLTGTCTDGDFRRRMISKGNLDGIVKEVANLSPVSIPQNMNHGEIKTLMRARNVRYLPVVDDAGVVVGVFQDDQDAESNLENVPIVLMAGGLGNRLRPLTNDIPKPLLTIGNKPIIARIIEQFVDQGFTRFYISINYLGHMIEDYLGNGSAFGAEISYLKETKKLGTAGALHLLPQNMKFPFLVMNSDIITDTDYREIVKFHLDTESSATMCLREHLTNIDFGVVNFEGVDYFNTDEKPTLTHHINAGIYCLSADALNLVPDNGFYDMPSLFDELTQENKPCSVYVLHNSWYDIGSIQQYEAVNNLFTAQ